MQATKTPALLPRGMTSQKTAASTATTVAVTHRNTIHWLSHHLSSFFAKLLAICLLAFLLRFLRFAEETLRNAAGICRCGSLALFPNLRNVLALVTPKLSLFERILRIAVMHEEDRQAERDAQQHERTGDAPPKLIERLPA